MTLPTEWMLSLERSKPMLDWADDWDTEGAKAFKPETWERVIRLLEALWAKAQPNQLVPTPTICPDSEGSIGIWWRFKGGQLYICVPEDASEACGYYGYDDKVEGEGHEIKGDSSNLETDHTTLIWDWLAQTQLVTA